MSSHSRPRVHAACERGGTSPEPSRASPSPGAPRRDDGATEHRDDVGGGDARRAGVFVDVDGGAGDVQRAAVRRVHLAIIARAHLVDASAQVPPSASIIEPSPPTRHRPARLLRPRRHTRGIRRRVRQARRPNPRGGHRARVQAQDPRAHARRRRRRRRAQIRRLRRATRIIHPRPRRRARDGQRARRRVPRVRDASHRGRGRGHRGNRTRGAYVASRARARSPERPRRRVGAAGHHAAVRVRLRPKRRTGAARIVPDRRGRCQRERVAGEVLRGARVGERGHGAVQARR